jgi:hypothetical protein
MDDPGICVGAILVWVVLLVLGAVKLASDCDPERNRH